MHDTINLIKKEIPVVVVVTEKFVNEALAVGKNFGLPEPPMVVVKHPFGMLNSTELNDEAEKAFDNMAQILTGPS